MLTAIIICLIIVAIFNLGIGLIVLLGSKDERAHRIFFLLASSVFLWALGIAFFLLTTNLIFAEAWVAIYYTAAAFIAYLSLVFALNYPENTTRTSIMWLLLLPAIGVSATLLVPNGLIGSVHTGAGGHSVQLQGGWYLLYASYFIVYLYGAFLVIAARMRRAVKQRDTRLHKQLKYMLIGMVLAGTFGTFFNLIVPWFGNYGLIWVGPLFSFLYITTIFYAIIRHKLFDVRLAFARVVAYVLLIVTMAIAYGIGIFSSSALLFPGSTVDIWRDVVYVILALFLAFTFQPLKNFFDRITDRIFFRDDYKLETTLSELGNATVNEIDLRRLMHKAQQALYDALKPNFISSIVFQSEDDHVMLESFGVGDFVSDKREAHDALIEAVGRASIKEDVVFKRAISDARLYQELDRYGVACVLQLRTKHELNGYMFIGGKQNGTMYRNKDSQLLNTAADELAIAIQNALRFEEIEHFNERLQGEIHDATAELRQTNKKLHVLDDAKDEFISMASHQLRTPLTSVKGYLSMVLEGDVGKITSAQRKVLEEAYTSAQRMVYLISDFLNVSRIQTGKFVLERTQTDLAAILTDEIEQLRVMAQGRQLTIEYVAPSHFPFVYIDQDKFRQVMMNFIDNAIYYSRPNEKIIVSLTKEVNDLVFKVIDHGIGVPSQERHRLFTKFYRATNARKQRPDGTGIGLFMAQKVIVAHGGSIIFESKENKGSTFGFRLPLKDNTKKLEK